MSANFSHTNPAWYQMLEEAQGDISLVERALVKAGSQLGHRAPTLAQVLTIIKENLT